MPGRRGLAVAAKLALTLAILGYLLHRSSARDVLEHMQRASSAWLALAVLQLALQPGLATWKWWLVLRALGSPLPFGRLFGVNYVGVFFSQVLPSTIGGDALRIWFAAREGVPARAAINAVALDRATTLVGLLLAALLGMPWSAPRLRDVHPSLPVVIPALLMAGLVGLGALAVADRVVGLAPALARRAALRALAALAEDARRALADPGRALAQLGLALASVTNLVVTCWLIGRALGLPLGLGDLLSVMPAVFFVSSVPVTLSGWGTRELATVALLATSREQAMALSVLFALCSLVVALPGAGFYVARRRRGELPTGAEVAA